MDVHAAFGLYAAAKVAARSALGNCGEQTNISGAFKQKGLPMSDEAKHTKRRRIRIYEEQVKSAHTTHWDLDYLPSDVVDSAYKKSEDVSSDHTSDSVTSDRP